MLYLFDKFRLDDQKRELRHGETLMEMEPKVFDFLTYVVENRDRVVTRDELIASVWSGRVVSESALATCINAARAAVQDDGESQRLIKTFPRKGIRFVGEVEVVSGDAKAALPSAIDALAAPSKPSIAVLPFKNLGGDPDQEYFADGMVEDLINGLSRVSWLFVIARNSTMIYRDKPADPRTVAEELGVRYVLEGSVRRSGKQVRINAHLIEADSAVQLWAERYDRSMEDLFKLQDDITMNVVGAIEPRLRKIEAERVKRKRPESLDAYDLVLRAMPFVYSHIAQEAAHAIPLLDKALGFEPGYAVAHAMLAWCYHFRFSRGGLKEEDRLAAVHHARAAITAGADDATALGMAAFVISLDEHDHAMALNLFDHALALSGSNLHSLCCSALVLSWLGRTDEAIDRAKQAVRLSPFDVLNYLSYNALAIAYLFTGKYQEALDAARSSVQLNPRFSVSHAFLTAALVRMGRLEEARAAANKVLTLDATFSISRFAVTVGIEPKVFGPLAEAWDMAGLPKRT